MRRRFFFFFLRNKMAFGCAVAAVLQTGRKDSQQICANQVFLSVFWHICSKSFRRWVSQKYCYSCFFFCCCCGQWKDYFFWIRLWALHHRESSRCIVNTLVSIYLSFCCEYVRAGTVWASAAFLVCVAIAVTMEWLLQLTNCIPVNGITFSIIFISMANSDKATQSKPYTVQAVAIARLFS